MSLWLPKPTFSISQMEGMEFCNRKYFMSTIAGIRINTVTPAFGNIAHDVIGANYEHRKKYGKSLDRSIMYKYFDDYFEMLNNEKLVFGPDKTYILHHDVVPGSVKVFKVRPDDGTECRVNFSVDHRRDADNRKKLWEITLLDEIDPDAEYISRHTVVENWEHFNPSQLHNLGKMFINMHMDMLEPSVKTVVGLENSIEVRFHYGSGPEDVIVMRGFYDLLTDDAVIDFKFRLRTGISTSDQWKVDNSNQLTLYAMATDRNRVGLMLHWLEKDRSGSGIVPAGKVAKSTRGKDDIKRLTDSVIHTATMIDKSKREGDFKKKSSPYACATKQWKCEFYDKCWGAVEQTDEFVYNTLKDYDSKKEAAKTKALTKAKPVFADLPVATKPKIALPF